MKANQYAAVPGKPNFIILMTDQQRTLQHFPEEWVRENLQNFQFFLDNGVVFENNICNASPCGPSRASIFSGLYPATNGSTGNFSNLSPAKLNFARVLDSAGYDIFYKGKLHMVEDYTKFSTTWPSDVLTAPGIARQEDDTLEQNYHMKGWTSPDFGTSLVQGNPSAEDLATLGGGSGYNDIRIVTGENMMYPDQESALDFLARVQKEKPEKPFCLVVSLVNPHDVSLYPEGYVAAGYENALFQHYEDFPLPNSYYNDDLSTKPQVQADYLKAMGVLTGNDPLNYVKFYAYLHTLTDRLHKTVFNAIGPELQKNTIVIRMADHGEMGMAHGGMVEKVLNFYNETCKIPMIWYHPEWFSKGKRNQLVSMIDLVPTIGTIAKADLETNFPELQGKSYEQYLFNESGVHADELLFNYYNPPVPGTVPPQQPAYFPNTAQAGAQIYNPPKTPLPPVVAPGNIYGILTREKMKYAVYFTVIAVPDGTTGNTRNIIDWSTAQFEMYDLNLDHDELENLLPPGVAFADLPATGAKLWAPLHERLTKVLETNNIAPEGWGDSQVPVA